MTKKKDNIEVDQQSTEDSDPKLKAIEAAPDEPKVAIVPDLEKPMKSDLAAVSRLEELRLDITRSKIDS